MADEQTPAPPGDKSVQLGIGTLIIIAIIVSMCSGKGEMEKVQNDTAELRKEVGEINQKLDQLMSKPAPAATPDVEAPAEPAANPAPTR